MPKPKAGTKLTYGGSDPLGYAARVADPEVDESKPYQSADLDMPPFTEVEVIGHDDERGLTLVQWEDTEGSTRITSVDSECLDRDFRKG